MNSLTETNHSALHLMWEEYKNKELQESVGFGVGCGKCGEPCMRQCACAEKEYIDSMPQEEVDAFVANGMKTPECKAVEPSIPWKIEIEPWLRNKIVQDMWIDRHYKSDVKVAVHYADCAKCKIACDQCFCARKKFEDSLSDDDIRKFGKLDEKEAASRAEHLKASLRFK